MLGFSDTFFFFPPLLPRTPPPPPTPLPLGMPPPSRRSLWESRLVTCSSKGDAATLKQLLDNPPPPDLEDISPPNLIATVRDSWGKSLVTLGVRSGKAEIIRELLTNENAKKCLGCGSGREMIIQSMELAEDGEEGEEVSFLPSSCEWKGKKASRDASPLHYAAHLGRFQVLQELMSYFSDEDVGNGIFDLLRDSHGDTILACSLFSRNLECFRFVLDRVGRERAFVAVRDWRDRSNMPLFHHSALIGSVAAMKLILEAGRKEGNEETSFAIHPGNVDSFHGNTPLHSAVLFDHVGVIHQLLAGEAMQLGFVDREVRNKAKLTALQQGVKNGRILGVAALLWPDSTEWLSEEFRQDHCSTPDGLVQRTDHIRFLENIGGCVDVNAASVERIFMGGEEGEEE